MPIIKKKKSKDFPPFHGNSSGGSLSKTPPSNNNNNNSAFSNIPNQNASGNPGGGSGGSSGSGNSQNGGQGNGAGGAGGGSGNGSGINPCPLCGGTNITILSHAQAITNVYTGKILCQNCGLGIERHRFNQRVTQSELIRDWNSL